MSEGHQVCSLFSGVRGYLDKIRTSEINRFEVLYLAHLEAKYPHILASITKTKELLPEIEEELHSVLKDWLPTSGVKMH